jgi:hypothetical protein
VPGALLFPANYTIKPLQPHIDNQFSHSGQGNSGDGLLEIFVSFAGILAVLPETGG